MNCNMEEILRAEVETLRKVLAEQKQLLSECRDVFEDYNYGVDCESGEFNFIVEKLDKALKE